jgi:hypothetical protein
MALVAYISSLYFGRLVKIGLEGIEFTIGTTILIGQVNIHGACLVAQATGDTVSALPVDVVRCGSIIYT